ncbi:MAG: YihY/virulence factor BrkB family protein, partial [Actinomycetes bacterium]
MRGRVRVARSRRPALDHAIRAYDRYTQVLGGQIAGALTFFGFLSFFPLIALAFSVLGYVAAGDPGVQDAVVRAVEDAFPGLVGSGGNQIDLQDVIDAKAGAGVIGILGLLYAGLGWVDALRDGLRRVFGTLDAEIGFVRKKLVDLAVLLLLGLSLLASVAVTSAATAATTAVLGWVGLADSVVAVALLKVLSVGVALLADIVLFAILLSRLSGAQLPWRRVRGGALLAAVGFEALKLFGTFLVGRTTDNPIYATFGVIVGLLVWISFASRVTVFAAAWTATEAFSLEPGDLGEPGSGRATALAASTEPVSVVAPPGYEPVPAGAGAADPVRRTSWRATVAGMVVGAAAAAALT